MAFRKKHIVWTGLFLLFALPCHAQDLRNQISEIEKERSNQELTLNNLRFELNQKTLEIEKIKKGNGSGIISKLLLQKKMREAQTVSKDLENLVKKHAQLSQELRKQRSNLLYQIDGQIQTLTTSKNSRKLPELQELQKLISEKDGLLALQQKELFEIPDFNLSSTDNDKEDLVEKLRVVEDLQQTMRQKIAFLKDELSEERSKEFLRNEVAHFIDEENFFGEQSFISNGLNRKDNGKNLNALALKKDASSNDTTTPSNTPTSPQAAPTTPTTPSTPTSPATPGTTPSTSNSTAPTTADATINTAAPQVTSESTSFQQPQDMSMFRTLLDQIQESIRDTNPKQNAKGKNEASSVAKNQGKTQPQGKNGILQQNIALSEQILNDLNILHQNLNRKIQTLE